MNIDTFALIKDTGSRNATIHPKQSTVSDKNGSYKIDFNRVLEEDSDSKASIFEECCTNMVEVFISGYNSSLLIITSQDSSKVNPLYGDGRNGLFFLTVASIFSRLNEEKNLEEEAVLDLGLRKDNTVVLTIFDVDQDNIRDLITSKSSSKVEEDAVHGNWAKRVSSHAISSPEDSMLLFKDAWYKSLFSRAGQSVIHSALFVSLELIVAILFCWRSSLRRSPTELRLNAENLLGSNLFHRFEAQNEPHKSQFTFIMLPNIEGLANPSAASRNLQSVQTLITKLIQNPQPERVIDYRDSALTRLLEQQLGGNCMTKALSCFTLTDDLTVQQSHLRFCQDFAQVRQFPILNDGYAQQLVTQMRANILYYRHKSELPPPTPPTLPQQPPDDHYDLIKLENNRLLETVERLQIKLDQMSAKFDTLGSSKSNLSAQLIESEQDKLNTTKAYIDMQLRNNQLREEVDASKYELTSKVLTLKHNLKLSEIERQKLSKEIVNQQHQIARLEVDRKKLADDYISVKASYMELADDLDREAAKNEELTLELLNIINAKSALYQQAGSSRYNNEAVALSREGQRIRGVLNKFSNGRPGRLKQSYNKREFYDSAFEDTDRLREQIDHMKSDFAENKRQLDARMETMANDLNSSRDLARERQQKISFLNARLITVTGEKEELNTVNNRLQHKIKDLNNDYRLRLTKYVEDLASHMDNQGMKKPKAKSEENMTKFVNRMLTDIKTAHKHREEQLSQAAQGYKVRLEKTVKKHESLLCAYRDLRSYIETYGLSDLDLGPDEHELSMSDPDLQSSQQKEILKLQSELHQLKISKQTNHDNQQPSRRQIPDDVRNRPIAPSTFTDLSSWTSVRKQLREFSESSLRELEEERAALMSKNVILKEQLEESKDYIDKHLARYKQEIDKLRRELAHKGKALR